jgi:hypothetical protein
MRLSTITRLIETREAREEATHAVTRSAHVAVRGREERERGKEVQREGWKDSAHLFLLFSIFSLFFVQLSCLKTPASQSAVELKRN